MFASNSHDTHKKKKSMRRLNFPKCQQFSELVWYTEIQNKAKDTHQMEWFGMVHSMNLSIRFDCFFFVWRETNFWEEKHVEKISAQKRNSINIQQILSISDYIICNRELIFCFVNHQHEHKIFCPQNCGFVFLLLSLLYG